MLNAFQRVCAAAFALDFAVLLVGTALPFFVFNRVGGGAAMSGTFGALQAASYAAVCLASLRFITKSQNGMHVAAWGVAFFTVLHAALPFFRNAYVCAAIATAGNGALALVWPALHSWVGAEPDPRVRARRMTWLNMSWSLGFAISPLFAGPLYDYDYRLPFLGAVVMNGLTITLILSLPHESRFFAPLTDAMCEARAGHDRASEVFLHASWCATIMANAMAGVLRSVYPKRVDALVAQGQLRLLFERHAPAFLTVDAATRFSWIASALAFTTALCFLLMGRSAWWQHRRGLLFGMQATAAIAFALLGHTRSLVVMAVCFVIVGANYGFCFFSSAYYSIANPLHKHGRAAINEGAVGTGVFAGSLIVGHLVERFGMAAPFHWTPLVVAAMLVVQAHLLNRSERRRRPPAPSVATPAPTPVE
ncbi:MAG TPA: hypothetical protein PLO37_18190 [Candidatus Hydrogenedentes bacterium]|nr:hypothetical protein [Candidatus Hydrogenedentota bacterium]HPG68781.1 hypothetical protein [Candidatus Hydrogenedentota bacterium]